MNFQGTQTLQLPVQHVWDALLDPEVLRRCIAGCDQFERTSDTEYASSVKVSIGPVSARFASTMTLIDLKPPQTCTLRFAGQGGVAGFGKGEARVTLTELAPDATRLDWSADAQVGGKLAQLGARLIEGTVRKMSDDFFTRFATQVLPQVPAPVQLPGVVQPAGGDDATLAWALLAALGGALAMLGVLWLLH